MKLPPVNLTNTDIGRYLLFASGDFISQYLSHSGSWEPWNLQISRLLLDGVLAPIVVDIGANLGAYSIPVAEYIRPAGGQVIAFEAQRIIYYQLCGNIFINGLPNCIAHHLALADQCGTISIPVPDYSTEINVGGLSIDENANTQQAMAGMLSSINDSSPREGVNLVTLDSLRLPRMSLLKIDVEGMEYEVLKGAAGTLQTQQFPPILFECWTEQKAPWYISKRRKTLALLESMGYSLQLMGEAGLAQRKGQGRYVNMSLTPEGSVRVELQP